MCEKCDTPEHHHDVAQEPVAMNRRRILQSGAGILAVPLLAGGAGLAATAGAAQAASTTAAAEDVTAYGFHEAKGHAHKIAIRRRAVGPDDVKMDVLYAGICHSDIHTIDGDWGQPQFPLVPGHEIIGRVTAVGRNVTRFKVGDIGGVGCMVDSCGECENCKNDREQNCLNGTTFTYGRPDKVLDGFTYGGYSKKIVVREHFVVNVPKQMDISRAAPIMCAGITTFSPMQHWRLEKGQRVGVVGIGGLGHMAVKLGVARGAEVTAFTTTAAKIPYIKKMGARDAILWSDKDAMQRLRGHFDLMITTVPEPYAMQPFINLLKLDATYVNVGQLGQIDGISGMMLGFGRQSLAGSMIGGMAETQQVMEYCATHNVLPDVEIIKPNQIDAAIARIKNRDIKFRFVIDMQNA